MESYPISEQSRHRRLRGARRKTEKEIPDLKLALPC
jgi:hypothetical protein